MTKAKRAEQLIKIAYRLSDIAEALADEGYDSEANSVRSVASRLGKIGRGLDSAK